MFGRIIVIVFALLLAIVAAGITLAIGIVAPDWAGVDADPIERLSFFIVSFFATSFVGTVAFLPALLAIVIGERACQLNSEEEADACIFGYSCINDVTARDLQDQDVQFTRAKGFDTFAPYGPCVAIGIDPSDLAISTRVNNETRQSSRTSQLIFSPRYLVWYISQIMTLMPGDVIATGTPSGIAPVHAGDVIEVEVEGIGILRNTVEKRPQAAR